MSPYGETDYTVEVTLKVKLVLGGGPAYSTGSASRVQRRAVNSVLGMVERHNELLGGGKDSTTWHIRDPEILETRIIKVVP